MPQVAHGEVPLATIPELGYFLIPHRAGMIGAYGKVLRQGVGSTYVKVYAIDHSQWEKVTWAPGAMVLPATAEEYNTQTLDPTKGPRANRERSAIESPVKVAHRIYQEMFDDSDGTLTNEFRKEMIAAAVAEGVNLSTAKTQYYHWKKTL